MLKVKTIVKESNIQGLGLFAMEDISKGTVVWEFDSVFDITFTKEEFDNMSDIQKELVDTYAFFSIKQNKYVYSLDNSRFVNHSKSDNNLDSDDMGGIELCGVANKDIHIGEEILANYKLFDDNDAQSDEEYLNS